MVTRTCDELIATQIDYYREMARSGRFDRSYERSGEYTLDHDLSEAWVAELAATESSLAVGCSVPLALELACGNGRWTRVIAARADRVLAVDSSPEMLVANSARTRAPNVDYLEADVFAWAPMEQVDLVVLCLWLSHVPAEMGIEFLRRVVSWVKPGGRVFLMDSLLHRQRVALDEEPPTPASPVHTRNTADGRTYTIPKIFFDPDTLRSWTRAAGLTGDMDWSGRFFFHGWLTPCPDAPLGDDS